MKRIVIFIDSLESGGAQRRAINIANLLKENLYDVTILTYHHEVFYSDAISNIKIDCLEEINKNKRLWKLLKYLINCNCDVVISFMDSPNYIACLAKMLGGKWRLITTESSAKKSSFEGKRIILNNLERMTNYKICNSRNSLNMWKKKYPFIRNKICVIYNPVLIGNENSDSQTEESGSQSPIKIIVAASYQYLKNPLGLVRAVAKLSEDDRKKIVINWFGRIEPTPGNRTAYDKTVKLINEYHLEECVHLEGETKEIYRLIMESDVVGLFSTVEGLPNAICEGMMLKKPVIMSMVSDYNVLVDGNGFLCDAQDNDSIVNALQQVINADSKQIKKMGERSYIIAQNLFSPNKVIKQWIQVIEG